MHAVQPAPGQWMTRSDLFEPEAVSTALRCSACFSSRPGRVQVNAHVRLCTKVRANGQIGHVHAHVRTQCPPRRLILTCLHWAVQVTYSLGPPKRDASVHSDVRGTGKWRMRNGEWLASAPTDRAASQHLRAPTSSSTNPHSRFPPSFSVVLPFFLTSNHFFNRCCRLGPLSRYLNSASGSRVAEGRHMWPPLLPPPYTNFSLPSSSPVADVIPAPQRAPPLRCCSSPSLNSRTLTYLQNANIPLKVFVPTLPFPPLQSRGYLFVTPAIPWLRRVASVEQRTLSHAVGSPTCDGPPDLRPCLLQ